jgi:hypothetical protein
MAIWYEISIDIMNAVYYIESRLRDDVAPLIGGRPFWRYEQWLATQRNRQPVLGDMAIPGVLGLLVTATCVWQWSSWEWWDYVGSLTNVAFIAFLGWKARCLLRARQRVRQID